MPDYGRIGPRNGSYSGGSSTQPRDIPARSRGPADDSWGASPSRSAAIGIPGGGGRRRRDSFDSISSGDESDGGYRRPSASTMAPRRDLPNPQGYRTYHHSTRRRDRDNIAAQGLYAGHHAGIGDPDGGEACTDGVYVVNPGRHIPDSRGGTVMVVSSQDPSHDPNYRGQAGVFLQPHVQPLRNARYGRGGVQNTYSAVFPMTPYTAGGAAAMIHHHNPDMDLSGEDAAGAMYSQFHQGFPMHAPHPEDPGQYYTPHSQYQQTLAPSSGPSGYAEPVSSVSYNTPPQGSFYPSQRHHDDPLYYDSDR